jgi:hypothetical protein
MPRQRLAMRLLLAIAALSVAVASVTAKSRHDGDEVSSRKWRTYRNARFGFVLSYPGSLIGSREPDNGDGREFHSRNGKFSVAAFAHFFVPGSGDSFEARWQGEMETPDVRITSQKKTDKGYSVSGLTKDGKEYFHKFFVNGSNWAALQITYPRAKHPKYEAWVARIEQEFVPFTKGAYDRID